MHRVACALAFVLALAGDGEVRAEDWGLTRERPATAPRARKHNEKSASAERAPADRGELQRARYLDLLLRNPMDTSALDRVLALYRERDGSLEGLLNELDAKIAREQAPALKLVRARVLSENRETERAREELRVLREQPGAPFSAWVLSARLEQAEGDASAAALHLRSALERTNEPAARRELLAQLAQVELERGDLEAAERCYDALLSEGRASAFQVTAFARALAARQQHARAAQAYRKALARFTGDPRARAPVMLELAKSELEAGETDAALETLRRARSGAAPGVQHALEELRLEAHRRAGRMQELADQLARGGSGFGDLEQLGRILDELGDASGALSAYRRALAQKPNALATRERVVALLSREGRIDEAIKEQRHLMRSRSVPRHAIRLAEMLRESGEQQEAVQLLDATALRSARDPAAVQALLELLSRWGEHERVTALLARLARVAPNDPSHLLALGEQLLEQGDSSGAEQAFKRALEASGHSAEGHAALGLVLLDHDLPERAVVELEAAVKAQPDHAMWLRSLAEALERVRRPADAIARWKELLSLSADRQLAREARRRIVLLWAQSGELRARITELERAFGYSPRSGAIEIHGPPDLEAGRLLAEAYRNLSLSSRRARGEPSLMLAAERVLERLLSHAPGDVSAMLALERSQSARGDYIEAEKTLRALLQADPKGAPTYLVRLADHAEAAYRDADALAYVEQLVSHSPKDAGARARLARLYRDRQDLARARASYEQAIELDPQGYAVHLELADLLLASGEEPAADGLLVRVMRGSSDDEQARRAALSLTQIRLARGTLASLEDELLPLSLGRGSRPLHRTLLCELYSTLARPWLAALSEGGPAAVTARERLRALGKRAVKPLLEALASSDPGARRVAVDLLGPMEHPSAAAALLGTAEREGDVELRRRALLAAGLVADEALTARLVALSNSEERRLRDAATWALARLSGGAAMHALETLAESPIPSVRGLALLGVSRRPGAKTALLARRALENDPSSFVRAAGALALATSSHEHAVSDLVAALRVEPHDVAAAAAVALGILQDARAASVLIETVFIGDELSRRAALWALERIAAARSQFEAPALPPPTDRASAEPVLEAFLAVSQSGLPSKPLELTFAAQLEAVARAALSGPREQARAALRVLSTDSTGALPTSTQRWLTPRLQERLLALATQPDAELRDRSLRLLAELDPESVGEGFASFLSAEDERLPLAALAALLRADARYPLPGIFERPLLRLLSEGGSWLLRQRAAEALARVGEPRVAIALGHALATDSSALVREAAARALFARSVSADVREALERARDKDAEPRVRAEAARTLLARP